MEDKDGVFLVNLLFFSKLHEMPGPPLPFRTMSEAKLTTYLGKRAFMNDNIKIFKSFQPAEFQISKVFAKASSYI